MKLSAIKVDSAVAAAGDWVKNIPDMDDLELKVRGTNCASARTLRNQLVRSLPSKVRTDPKGIPIETLDQIEAKVNAQVILLDWRNLDGVPYSPEKAKELLTDPDYIFFREAVSWAATRVGRQEAEAHEAEVGNSPNTSAGT
jgi:hypothetical protein